MSDRASAIEEKLRATFAPSSLLVKDQSHLHAGHAGAQDGRGHFDVTIAASAFNDQSRIKSHQMIYAALGDMMKTDIHALSISASGESDDHS